MPDRTPHAVISLSGGMDSATAVAEYHAHGYRLTAVSFNYGQRHARELVAASAIAGHYGAKHEVVDISDLGRRIAGSALTDRSVAVPHGHYAAPEMRSTVVPNRNNVFAHLTVMLAMGVRADVVVLGIHAGDHAVYPDCRPPWVHVLRAGVEIGNEGFYPPRIDTPFLTVDKTEIARRGAALGVPYGLTWSCYEGGPVHCGACPTCVERIEAFTDAGVFDPTEYATTDGATE